MPAVIKKGSVSDVLTLTTDKDLTGATSVAFRWSNRYGTPATVVGTATPAEVSAGSTGSVYTYQFTVAEHAAFPSADTPYRGELYGDDSSGDAFILASGDGFWFTITNPLA